MPRVRFSVHNPVNYRASPGQAGAPSHVYRFKELIRLSGQVGDNQGETPHDRSHVLTTVIRTPADNGSEMGGRGQQPGRLDD